MSSPLLTAQETSPSSAILIVDKEGVLGDALAATLVGDFRVALATSAPLHGPVSYIHIPFKAKIPRIPDDTFSHIFLLFGDEKELIELLPQFSQKAYSSGAPLVLITSIYTLTKEKLAHIKRHAPDAILFIYGDIGGTTLPSQVNELILEAVVYGALRLPNNGLFHIYPTPLPYFLGGVLTIVFGKREKGKTYFLFSKNAMTTLSFARELKKVFPDIRLDFSTEKKKAQYVYIPTEGEYLLFPSIGEWMRTLSFPKTPFVQSPTVKKRRAFFTTRPRFDLRWIFVCVFALFILPFSLSISSALAGGLLIKSGVQELSRASFAKGERDFSYAKKLFAFAEFSSVPFSLLETLNISSPASLVRTTLGAGEDISNAGLLFVQAGRSYDAITNGKSKNPDEDMQLVIDRLKRGLTIFQKLEAEKELPAIVSAQLKRYKAPLHLLSAMVDSLPALTGFPDKKTYLVLFQNNKELRAGGGFIGSYGMLSVFKGKIQDFTLHDVYDADGQLKGHVEPPFALRRYLGANHWYLRDSNYAIDFPKNAERAQFFLEKETGESVSGVLSVDATALEDLLRITGPISLPDYNQTITAENAFTLLETKTQENFFPGSSQKKNMLAATYTALKEKVFSTKQNSGKLLELLSSEFAQKHIMIASNDEALQKVLATNRLSSAVPVTTGDKSMIEDFMGVNEMNLGQNKVNAYVERTLDHTVTIDEKGVLMAGTSVSLKNTSTTTSLYGGDYDVYIRFITPLQSQFLSFAINGIEQPTAPAETNTNVYLSKLFKPAKGVEIEKTEEMGKMLYGVHVMIPAGTEKKLTVTYALPGEKSDATFMYQLTLFKQPGTLNDPLSVSVNFPNSFSVLKTSQDVVTQNAVVTYQQPFVGDTIFSTVFARKK